MNEFFWKGNAIGNMRTLTVLMPSSDPERAAVMLRAMPISDGESVAGAERITAVLDQRFFRRGVINNHS